MPQPGVESCQSTVADRPIAVRNPCESSAPELPFNASVRVLLHTRSSTYSTAWRVILRQWRRLMMFLAVAYAHAAGAANDYGSLLKLAHDWRGFEQPVKDDGRPAHRPR